MDTTILGTHARKIKENLDDVKLILITLANQNVISDKNHAAILAKLGEAEKFIPDFQTFIKHVMEHGESHLTPGHQMTTQVRDTFKSMNIGNGKTLIIK